MASVAPRPLSLQARSLLAAGVALAAFLGLTGFALDAAIYETLRTALHDRLQSYAYGYLAGSEVSRARRWLPPEVGPDPRFDRPGSGLYAGVVAPVEVDGVRQDNWRSQSATGMDLPLSDKLPPNTTEFALRESPSGKMYVFSIGVRDWDPANRGAVDLTLHIAEDTANLSAQLDVFRRTLLVYLGGLGLLLLALLMATLRWSLHPLRRVATDLARVERGDQDRLSEHYPLELSGLATNLNEFIESERDHLARYRNNLADLAHSLKTPLAVMRSQLESGAEGEKFRWTVLEQVGRMDQIVAYQLSRAATSGHTTFVAPIRIEAHAEEVVGSLEKVYAARRVTCEFEIDAQAVFYGEMGDLLELLGNLIENAFKWARKRVLVSARPLPQAEMRRPGLEIVVEDDGDGIPEDQVEHLLQRGVRGDERVQGHGIGLAIVEDLIRAYRGELVVSRSPSLGGARFAVRFKAS
ncbi:MAG TPA: ATP-binding protein [Rudaea sp.]|nr:ATP-binding protein [Rudaea sp.]